MDRFFFARGIGFPQISRNTQNWISRRICGNVQMTIICYFGKATHRVVFSDIKIYSDGDAKKALGTAREIIAQNPDYYESISSIAYSFRSNGLEQVFFDFLSDLSVPGFNR